MNPKEQTYIITGGLSGIGLRLVTKLRGLGVKNVVVLDTDDSAVNQFIRRFPDYLAIMCDVRFDFEIEKALDHVYKKYQAVHVLVNNAAMIHNELLVSAKLDTCRNPTKHQSNTWQNVMAVNMGGVFNATKCVASRMVSNRTRGLILNVSSVVSTGNAGQGAYASSKAAVRSLTTTWSKELAMHRIRVAGLAPGYTNTHTTLDNLSEPMQKHIKSQIPLRRFATTEEIVHGMMFIIENDYFNGRTLELDGGLRL